MYMCVHMYMCILYMCVCICIYIYKLLNHVEYLQGSISITRRIDMISDIYPLVIKSGNGNKIPLQMMLPSLSPIFSRKFPSQRGSSQQQHPRRVESAALATDPALWPAPHHRPRATRTQGLDSAHPSCGLCCLGVLVLAFSGG